MRWLSSIEKLMLKRESAVRRDMFIELRSINQSKLRRSDMGTSRACNAVALRAGRLFMPLLTELGRLRDGFCYRRVAPNGALKSARARSATALQAGAALAPAFQHSQMASSDSEKTCGRIREGWSESVPGADAH